ncbi:OTU domain-containing protein 3 isoform X1 [Coffea eugenioides]|uniref:OTU domain-containing protein 3 isoform X1 n=2 Tax=Coffea eugenioides TaxID=49369 RepID=UPI000F614D6B|nr:OTU domain-containing protein 3 isoform X1 [Coffea eugenioides]XP_027150907.1 OTU domain-containing protein 3 isoform X1 [Coffea eugenioides]XP_027150908.1 OTU domain-containing protein 3 isoform X1 [Coffea eugenioides]
MVKTKHQTSKPTAKSAHIKKAGKQADISEFKQQLDALGLKIIQVTADGNCFFSCCLGRALADQLEGNEEEHEKYRNMVVRFIMKNREMFEPFIEDEVPFDEYCQSMEKDGTWAGHMELQAASLVTHCNICIHRHISPRWYIQNFDNCEAKMIHLSYHDGEHYNSVRSKDDTCAGPARPIVIKADADLSATSHHAKSATTKSMGDIAGNNVQPRCLKMVMTGSGCEDVEKVKKVLQEVGGDADAAIEYLIAQQNSEESLQENVQLYISENTVHGEHDSEILEQHSMQNEKKTGNTQMTQIENSLSLDDKKIPRNKACPCGSKKKYKSCCGSVAGKSSARFSGKQSVDDGNDRKDKKQRKKAPKNVLNHDRSEGGLPDMGALCI